MRRKDGEDAQDREVGKEEPSSEQLVNQTRGAQENWSSHLSEGKILRLLRSRRRGSAKESRKTKTQTVPGGQEQLNEARRAGEIGGKKNAEACPGGRQPKIPQPFVRKSKKPKNTRSCRPGLFGRSQTKKGNGPRDKIRVVGAARVAPRDKPI